MTGKKPPPMTADELRTARERMQLTQKQLAEELKTSPESVENWEQGRRGVPTWVPNTLRLLRKLRNLDDK